MFAPSRLPTARRSFTAPDLVLAGVLTGAALLLLSAPVLGQRFLGELTTVGLAAPVLFGAAFIAWRWPVYTVWAVVTIPVINGTAEAYLGIRFGPLAELLAIGLALSTVWAVARGHGCRPVGAFGLLLLGAYLVVTATSILAAESLGVAVDAFRQQFLILLLVPALAFRRWTPDERRRMLRGFVVVALVAGLYAMFRYLTGPSGAEADLLRRTGAQTVNGEVGLIGSFLSRQELSGWTGVAIPALVALVPLLQARWRLAVVIAFGTCTAALLASQTRAGLAAALGGTALVIGLVGFARNAGSRAGALIVTIAVVFALAAGGYGLTVGGDDTRSSRIAGVFNPTEDVTFDARRAKWRETMRALDGKPVGYGLGTAGSVVRERGRFITVDTFNIDNSYLQLAYQQGFAMVALLLAAMAALLTALIRAAINGPSGEAPLRLAATGAVLAWLLVLTAGSYVERECTVLAMLLLGLALARSSVPSGRGPAAEAQ